MKTTKDIIAPEITTSRGNLISNNLGNTKSVKRIIIDIKILPP